MSIVFQEGNLAVSCDDYKQLTKTGTKLIKTKGSLFHDLNAIIEHPLFLDFAHKYFTSWKSTQIVTKLCRMYADLDHLSPHISNPYEKIALLKDVILTNLLTDGSTDGTTRFDGHREITGNLATLTSNDVLVRYTQSSANLSSETRIELGQQLYQTQPVLRDVADIMEYENTGEFVKKYFLQWDTSDLVVVLIRLYECFDRFVDWTPEQKFGFLHYLMSDPNARQVLVSRISDWKNQ
jgi:hypothetical protein